MKFTDSFKIVFIIFLSCRVSATEYKEPVEVLPPIQDEVVNIGEGNLEEIAQGTKGITLRFKVVVNPDGSKQLKYFVED